jgi:hypothetical protein
LYSLGFTGRIGRSDDGVHLFGNIWQDRRETRSGCGTFNSCPERSDFGAGIVASFLPESMQ